MAALLSLLINVDRRKRDRHLHKCRAYPRGSKKRKKAKDANMRGKSCSKVKKHSNCYFIAAVKSSEDIAADI